MSNLSTSGPKCIVLKVGVFLLILLYSMFPLMVEYCVQEYMNCGAPWVIAECNS